MQTGVITSAELLMKSNRSSIQACRPQWKNLITLKRSVLVVLFFPLHLLTPISYLFICGQLACASKNKPGLFSEAVLNTYMHIWIPMFGSVYGSWTTFFHHSIFSSMQMESCAKLLWRRFLHRYWIYSTISREIMLRCESAVWTEQTIQLIPHNNKIKLLCSIRKEMNQINELLFFNEWSKELTNESTDKVFSI